MLSRPQKHLNPLVSVIMPTFNSAAVLERAVTSVRCQSYTNWELLIVDDKSQDDTASISKTLATQDNRISVSVQETHLGAAATRNRAISCASGRYIAFLDADDEWLPAKLSSQVSTMQESGAALCYTGFWRQKFGSNQNKRCVHVPPKITRKFLLRGNVIGCLTAIYDRDQLGTVFMPILHMRHDFALWLDILARVDSAVGIDLPLAIYHQSPNSLSANKWHAQLWTWRVYRFHLGLPRHLAVFYLLSHLFRRVARG